MLAECIKQGCQAGRDWEKIKVLFSYRKYKKRLVPLSRSSLQKVRMVRRRITKRYYEDEGRIDAVVDRILKAIS